MENKADITKAIFEMFKTMRYGVNIWDMEYYKPTPYEERVLITLNNNETIAVNVNCDSGIAMLKDILKALGEN